jgi:hypothetical protein
VLRSAAIADAKPLLSAEQAECPVEAARLLYETGKTGETCCCGGIFALPSLVPPTYSVLSVLCSLRLSAPSVLPRLLSFFHAAQLPVPSKRPGLALQLPASHFPLIVAVLFQVLLQFLVRALAAHTLTTQYPLFLHLTGSRNPSAYPVSAPNTRSTSLRV